MRGGQENVGSEHLKGRGKETKKARDKEGQGSGKPRDSFLADIRLFERWPFATVIKFERHLERLLDDWYPNS